MKDSRSSRKLGIVIRRIRLCDGTDWSIRPSFVMPSMAARTEDVQAVLFLRKFAVPFWALAEVIGRDPMFYYRLQSSLLGTTVRRGTLLADEDHQKRDGKKTYIAATVGESVWLGAEIAESAGTVDLTTAYGVFRDEALNIDPEYKPDSVNTDGWSPTQTARGVLFSGVTVLVCFLHAWLKIRCRGKKHELFSEVSRRVWEAYHATNRRSFS
jgi:hypothetical protein